MPARMSGRAPARTWSSSRPSCWAKSIRPPTGGKSSRPGFHLSLYGRARPPHPFGRPHPHLRHRQAGHGGHRQAQPGRLDRRDHPHSLHAVAPLRHCRLDRVGKSTAVSLLLHKAVSSDPKLRVIILDPHNEFSSAFPGNFRRHRHRQARHALLAVPARGICRSDLPRPAAGRDRTRRAARSHPRGQAEFPRHRTPPSCGGRPNAPR